MSQPAPVERLPQRVLLTGASRGIGAAIAAALIDRGVQLAVLGRDRAALEAVVGARGPHVVIEADLASQPDVEACVAQAVQGLGGLDAFISCAGIVEYVEVGAVSRESLQRQLDVNLVAPFLLAQRVAPELERSGGGSMLLIASSLGLSAAPMTSAYALTKAALISMTRSFALELGPRGIRVNAIAPGVVDTDMVRVVRTRGDEVVPRGEAAAARIEAQLAHLRSLHPLGRLGQSVEIAESALYLLAAEYVTGAVVSVDGGLLLGNGEL